jgi:hypothetical protein
LPISCRVEAQVSSGLASPHPVNWPLVAERLAATKRFAAAVVMLGTNDGQDLWERRHRLAFGTPAWQQAYARRLDRVVDAFCSRDVPLLWTELPAMRSPKLSKRLAWLNGFIAKQLARHGACAQIVPLGAALGEGQRTYLAVGNVDGRKRRLRMADGIHLTAYGAELMGRSYLERLAPLFTGLSRVADAAASGPLAR